MVISGLVVLTPAYLSFEMSNIQVHLSTMSGVSTLLIGALLLCCGAMVWFQSEGRLLAGIAAMILAVVAIPTSNFGGFFVGSLCALIGGALSLAWAPGPRPDGNKRARRDGEES
ncbi:hypothetical protein C3E79_04850 [Corynebacterium liangguodongii]|uniref:Uncharacterized protein n=2 Tax=Corynebacterium liangguodongii TaxID=2079535 RepID=A0A2S0WDN6_9CORY|nr:hypothetical protein C3E79_04850 [Corynebacterium liangguodongii]PWB99027.1 hypothetical protein DF219_08500 [Corynebacterium liangguodongii]